MTSEKIIELLTLYPDMSLSNIVENPDSLGNAIIEKLTELEAVKEAAKDFISKKNRNEKVVSMLWLSESQVLDLQNLAELLQLDV